VEAACGPLPFGLDLNKIKRLQVLEITGKSEKVASH
jgi:hypothetical protein